MEKEVFVKIIDAIVEFNRISDGLDKVLQSDVNFGVKQMEDIIEALEIQFDDVEGWINWWLYEAGEKKEMTYKFYPTRPSTNNKDIIWEIYDEQEETIKLPTAGDLYDFLDWNMANS